MVLKGVVDAHGRGGVIEAREGLVVGLELLEGMDEPGGVSSQRHPADIG